MNKNEHVYPSHKYLFSGSDFLEKEDSHIVNEAENTLKELDIQQNRYIILQIIILLSCLFAM